MYEIEASKNRRVMDRNAFKVDELPEGYKCNDVTDQFALNSKIGLRLSRKHKWGLAFVGPRSIGSCETLRMIMRAMEEGQTGYLVLAIDRVFKELMYVCL